MKSKHNIQSECFDHNKYGIATNHPIKPWLSNSHSSLCRNVYGLSYYVCQFDILWFLKFNFQTSMDIILTKSNTKPTLVYKFYGWKSLRTFSILTLRFAHRNLWPFSGGTLKHIVSLLVTALETNCISFILYISARFLLWR